MVPDIEVEASKHPLSSSNADLTKVKKLVSTVPAACVTSHTFQISPDLSFRIINDDYTRVSPKPLSEHLGKATSRISLHAP
jgi:hypothetical protein